LISKDERNEREPPLGKPGAFLEKEDFIQHSKDKPFSRKPVIKGKGSP